VFLYPNSFGSLISYFVWSFFTLTQVLTFFCPLLLSSVILTSSICLSFHLFVFPSVLWMCLWLLLTRWSFLEVFHSCGLYLIGLFIHSLAHVPFTQHLIHTLTRQFFFMFMNLCTHSLNTHYNKLPEVINL
jgi:hypothetical protein